MGETPSVDFVSGSFLRRLGLGLVALRCRDLAGCEVCGRLVRDVCDRAMSAISGTRKESTNISVKCVCEVVDQNKEARDITIAEGAR